MESPLHYRIDRARLDLSRLSGLSSIGVSRQGARASMARGGPDEKIHPVGKLAAVVTALAGDGVALEDALSRPTFAGSARVAEDQGFHQSDSLDLP